MSIRPYQELRDKLRPEAREAAHKKALEILEEIRLGELRQARKVSQVQLAKKLKVNQAAVSKLERRADMYISTLRKVIVALGGELEITAKFPDGNLRIKQLAKTGRHVRASKRVSL